MARRIFHFPVRGYLFGHDTSEPLMEAEVCSYPHPGTKVHIKGQTYTIQDVVILTERELMYVHLEHDKQDIPMEQAMQTMHALVDPGVRLA